MFEAFKKLKLASAFLGSAVHDQGGGTFSAADIFGELDANTLEKFGGDIDAIFEGPGVTQLYDNGYMPPPESPDVLLDLPDDTLGYQLGLYLRRHKLTIAPPGPYDPKDRVAYIRERVRMLHPLIHVLTEYDASPVGELAVQAFFVGQFGNLASGTILAAGLLRLIQETPEQLGDALQLVAEAFERGRSARSLLGMPWEELLPAPSAQIRDLFGLPPRTSTTALLDVGGAQAPVAFAEPEPEPEPAPEPAPEPEPEPTRLRTRRTREPESGITQRTYGGRPKTRWAGLDLLSQAAADPTPAPEPEPEPEPAPSSRSRPRRSKPEPSTLAQALSNHTAETAKADEAAKAARVAKPRKKEVSPLASFFEAASAEAAAPPTPEAPRLDLRAPPRRVPPRVKSEPHDAAPPKNARAADAPSMTRRRSEPPPPPKQENPPEVKTEEPTERALPKPGDRDYF